MPPADELEQLVDEDDGSRDQDDQEPLAEAQRNDAEYGSQQGDVEDGQVKPEGDRHGDEQPRVPPWRH